MVITKYDETFFTSLASSQLAKLMASLKAGDVLLVTKLIGLAARRGSCLT